MKVPLFLWSGLLSILAGVLWWVYPWQFDNPKHAVWRTFLFAVFVFLAILAIYDSFYWFRERELDLAKKATLQRERAMRAGQAWMVERTKAVVQACEAAARLTPEAQIIAMKHIGELEDLLWMQDYLDKIDRHDLKIPSLRKLPESDPWYAIKYIAESQKLIYKGYGTNYYFKSKEDLDEMYRIAKRGVF